MWKHEACDRWSNDCSEKRDRQSVWKPYTIIRKTRKPISKWFRLFQTVNFEWFEINCWWIKNSILKIN